MEILSIDLAIARSAQTGREVRLEPDGSMLSPAAAYFRKLSELREVRAARKMLVKTEGAEASEDASRLAVQLTREIPSRLSAPALAHDDIEIGLELSGATFSGGAKLMSIAIRDGAVYVDEDKLPASPSLVIKTSAGVWAGILSGRQAIESAYLHGKLRLTGPVETALNLKKLFRL